MASKVVRGLLEKGVGRGEGCVLRGGGGRAFFLWEVLEKGAMFLVSSQCFTGFWTIWRKCVFHHVCMLHGNHEFDALCEQ